MGRYKDTFLFIQLFICVCFCEISHEKKEKLLNGFIDYYNNLPNQLYTCEEGLLHNAQQIDPDCYKVEVQLKISDQHNLDSVKYVKCISTVQDLYENGVTVLNNDHQCHDMLGSADNGGNIEEAMSVTAPEITEPPFQRKPVQLDNEVQPSTDATSGEQFIAIPREKPKVLCVGCSSHVNPQAAGVTELAALGVKQLNIHEPNIKHTLNSVVEVERQAQVVNGIRYTLTLLIDYNSCTETQTESCLSTNACKLSILEKPWIILHDGSKHRAILSNNCTKEWLFGDDGVVLPQNPTDNRENNEIDINSSNGPGDAPKPNDTPGTDDLIKVVHTLDVQSQQNQQKVLTDDDIKNLEEQIIPNNQFFQPSTESSDSVSVLPDMSIVSKQDVKVESAKHRSDDSIPTHTEKTEPSAITEDKRKAIDDMQNFFKFAGFDSKGDHEEEVPRMKRSYDYDLKVMSLTEKFAKVKKNIDNAKYVYKLAQTMVDYMNEMDMEVKNRVLKYVIIAEEEFENYQHFFYIQARVIIPCEKADCDDKDTITKICNAVIDTSNKRNLQILNTFCYDDESKKKPLGKVNSVRVDDPVLLNLVKNALNKIEFESSNQNAINLYKIIDANTQKVSGTLTKISLILNYLDCKKTVPLVMRANCSVLEHLGSNVCEVIIHERHWLKERKITHSCTKRPIEGSFSNTKHIKNSINNPTVNDMLKEALQYLEVQSNRNYKQKIVKVNSVSTQLIAGFLTDIEFVVGYTTCTNNDEVILNKCRLLENEPLKICKAQIWDRTWIEDGRQVDVSCKEPLRNIKSKDFMKLRKKRSLDFVGGQTPKNVSDPIYKSLAEDSLQKFLQTSGDHQQYSIIKIEQVTVQVVSGLLTRIKFKISPTNCLIGYDGQPSYNECEIKDSADVINCYSEIWEQPWLDNKQINVTCGINNQLNKTNRQAGELLVQDANDCRYKKLAEESMQKYLETSGNTQVHKVVKIERVTTQVVSGSITRIDFKVSPVTQKNTDIISCHSVVWEQPWLQKKDIKVICQIDNQYHRNKNYARLGGLLEQDPNDPKYKALAEESMQKYLETSGNTQVHKVVKIERVTTQVVSGSITRIDFKVSPVTQENTDIISCHSEVWEQPWLQKKDIKVNCQIDNQYHRNKRVTLPGGLLEKDPNDPKYKALAEESMQKYLETSGNTQVHKVVKIERVTTQVVSGRITRIDFKVSPVTQENTDIISCHSEVWEQPWLQKKDIKVNCQIDHQYHRNKRDVKPGGLLDKDPNDPKYKALAEESMQKYLETSGNTQVHKVVKIERVTTQVVSGSITRIDFKVSPVTQENTDIISCHSEVWEQPWLQKKDIKVNCQIDNQYHRNKRYARPGGLVENDRKYKALVREKHSTGNKRLLGSPQVQDPNKREYLLLAQDSLKKYQRLHNSATHHKIVEVVNVVTKVVSGIIYRIGFTAAETKCSSCPLLYCYAEIWDRPWLKRKQIDVSCDKHEENRKKRSLLGAGEVMDFNNELHEDPRLDERGKRQTGNTDDYIDEDIVYYYADRAIKHFNEVSDTNNLHKLVSIQAAQSSMQMDTLMVRMYIEIVVTYCLRHADEGDLENCEEMDGMNHRLCLARLWPSPDDELILDQVSVVCDDNENFESITGLSIPLLIKASINELEKSPQTKYKLVHLGEPRLIPSLDSSVPMKMNFLVASTNCSKDIDIDKHRLQCYIDTSIATKSCLSLIWMAPNSRIISKIKTDCTKTIRQKRSISLDLANSTADDLLIHKLVQESLDKLEMSSLHRYKQRVLQINSFSSKITSGKVTTIDFDVGYTSCLKYEWVENITRCEFLEHLPRRHCVSQIFERLWLNNGRNIEVNCEDDETPLEAHVEFESAESAKKLANEALKHIEAKYPHPRKQKVVRIFSLEKQVVAGIHYRMKIEVGLTDCTALSTQTGCKLLKGLENSKFCRVNVWIRPWTDHPPNFRVTCDYQEGAAADLYHRLQAEYLFSEYLVTYKPDYVNDHAELLKRFGIFEANIRKIHELNTHERGTARYAVTRFADQSYEEFSSKYMGLKTSLRDSNQVPMRKASIPRLEIPDKFDWRDHGAVTEVKDQGSCGSCWAFSVTGNIEGQWKMESGQLVSLSEQELVDCDKLDEGCSGGLPDNAYRAIEQLGGLEAENDYPYEGEDDKCVYNKTLSKVQISGAVNISSNETDMAKWLVKNGPISIGINANAMQFYVGGVSHPWKMLCNPTNLDHGVLIVGYGTKDYPLFHKRLPYWIVKNSWGKMWGEQGYYRVYRGDGTCGVNQMASSAVI